MGSTKPMSLNELRDYIHNWAHGKGFYPREPRCLIQNSHCHHSSKTFAGQVMLAVTELGEAVEGDRKGDMANRAEEIADTIIRLLDLCGAYRIDIQAEIEKKMKINEQRPQLHGKRY